MQAKKGPLSIVSIVAMYADFQIKQPLAGKSSDRLEYVAKSAWGNFSLSCKTLDRMDSYWNEPFSFSHLEGSQKHNLSWLVLL